MGTYPDTLVEAVAIALFDYQDQLTLQMVENMDAEGRPDFGNVVGRQREAWDNPFNAKFHDGYRRWATAALDAISAVGLTISAAEARVLLHGMPDYDFSIALTRIANWLAEYDQMPTPPGNQIRTAECDGQDAVPVTGQLPVGTASPQPEQAVLDWTGFKGIQRNREWLPTDQELIHTAMNVYDGDGDMDDDAREQIIERLLFAWQNAELAAATSNAHRHELMQQVERYRSERPYVVGFKEGFDVASKQTEERFVRLRELGTKVCETEQEFREQMPSDWEGDPITDAVAYLRAELADDVSGTSESLERRLAECLSSCIDEPLLKGFLGGDGRIPTEIRLGFFRPEIADKAAELLEEFGI